MKKGWITTKFGDLGRVFNGNSISENEKKAHYAGVEKGVPYIGTKDVGFDSQIEYDSGVKIPPSRQDGFKLAPANSVLVCAEGGSAGRKIAHTDSPIYFGNKLFAIFPKPETNSRFVFYYCLSDDFLEAFRGSMAGLIGGVSLNKFKDLKIELPPLAEQQRIVGVLDEAFAGLATAQAHAAQNLQNARALFESHLQAVFTQRGPGWERITLEELLQRGWIESHLDGNHGSDYPRKEEFIAEGIPYISANCIEDDRIDMTKSKFLSPERAALLRKGIARNNDVLFAHNATVGPVAILRTTEPKVILGTSLTYYRCNTKHIVPEYLAHYMRSSEFTSQYSQVMKQSTRNQVPITKQREFFHIIPPIEEQKRLIHALEGLFENTQRLAGLYERKRAALEALKKSLLHQAFAGEL